MPGVHHTTEFYHSPNTVGGSVSNSRALGFCVFTTENGARGLQNAGISLFLESLCNLFLWCPLPPT